MRRLLTWLRSPEFNRYNSGAPPAHLIGLAALLMLSKTGCF
jgi:hypothetical protein